MEMTALRRGLVSGRRPRRRAGEKQLQVTSLASGLAAAATLAQAACDGLVTWSYRSATTCKGRRKEWRQVEGEVEGQKVWGGQERV